MDKAKGLVAALAAMGLEESKVQELYGDVIEPIKASDPRMKLASPRRRTEVQSEQPSYRALSLSNGSLSHRPFART